jgi:hypothetical protein
MSTSARNSLAARFASIGIAKEYSSIDLEGLEVDLQGWGSKHTIFEEVFREIRPEIVIEVGSWKGASLLHMHALSRTYGYETCFVCVDTWTGSSEHWLSSKDRPSLMLRDGYPTIFRQFVFNLTAHDATEDVFPLPTTSTSGAKILRQLGVIADVVYIDGGHEEEEVAADLKHYFDLLRPGGVMFGGEYHPRWAGTMRAVDRFRKTRRLKAQLAGGWWLLRKPE